MSAGRSVRGRRYDLRVALSLVAVAILFALAVPMAAQAAQEYTISGTVTTQDGSTFGVTGTQVTVSDSSSGEPIASAITDMNGSYSVSVPVGTYNIAFVPPLGSDYQTLTDAGVQVSAPIQINVQLVRAIAFVRFSGVLRDGGGESLSNWTVHVSSPSADVRVATGGDGSFSFMVPAGLDEVVVEGPASNIYFASGEFTEDLHRDLTLPVHALTVRTVGASGDPVAGVTLSMNINTNSVGGELAPGMPLSRVYVQRSVETSTDGTAVLEVPDLTGSEDSVRVTPPASAQLAATNFNIDNITSDQTVTEQLQAIAFVRFSGVLRDGGGESLSNWTVHVSSPSADVRVATGGDGSFSFMVPAGLDEVVVEGPASNIYFASGEFTEDLHRDLTLPVHALTVRTVGASGDPVAGVTLSMNINTNSVGGELAPGMPLSRVYVQRSVETSTDGTAVLEVPDLTGSEDSVRVTPPASAQLAATNFNIDNITSDQTVTEQLQAIAFVRFSGVLRDGGGESLSNWTVHVSSPSADVRVATGGDGSFSFMVPAGLDEVVVEGPASNIYFASGEFTEDLHRDLTLPVHALTVRTVGASGDPVAGVTLSMNINTNSVGGELAPGMPLSRVYVQRSVETSTDGTAVLEVPDLTGSEDSVRVTPPASAQLAATNFNIDNITSDQTKLVAFQASGTDTTPPSISCQQHDSAWHAANVSLTCTASDAGTGLASPGDASFMLSTNVAEGVETANALTGPRRVCDLADNCATAGPVAGIKIDRAPPSITITQPVDGALLAQGGTVLAEYACTDGGSGVASCEGSTPSGHALDTSTPGQYSLSVSAVDAAGNAQTRTVHYTVVAPSANGCSAAVALCQTGVGDITAPNVAGLTVSPASVDTSSGSRTVTVAVHATDDLSGVAAVQVSLSDGTRWFSAPAQIEPSDSGLDGTWTAVVTLPANAPPGSYRLSVSAIDGIGNAHTYTAADLEAMGLASSVTQTGAGDTTPPGVLGVTISPPSVSTCEAAQTVTVDVHASDGVSGVASVRALLSGPGGRQIAADAAPLPGGSSQDEHWSAALTLPAHARQGAWSLSLQAVDVAGNPIYLSSDQLAGLGFDGAVQQTCAGDVTAPQVAGVTISPTSVDTSTGAQTVTVDVHATDDISGVASINATLSAGSQQVSAPATLQPEGTPLDGTWRATLTLPRYAQQGAWALSLSASDGAGNATSLSASQLGALGLPDSIAQTGIADGTAPAVAGVSVAPNVIDTSAAAREVQVHIHATDDLSGVSGVFVQFSSAHSQHVSGWATLDHEGGTPQDGNWTARVMFPRFSEQGAWTLRLDLWDAIGNHRGYTSEELSARGLLSGISVNPPSIACESPPGGWSSANVTISCTASDAQSGLADPADASFSLATSVPPGEETAAAPTGSHQVCDMAGACSTAGPITGIKVDRKPPSVAIVSPANGVTVTQGASLIAQYACSDGGSGVASCSGSVSNGQPLDTSVVGQHTLTVNAVDGVGNPATATASYTVISGRVVLSSSENPAPFGAKVTFTARINPSTPGGPTPTGTVSFQEGATVLGTATLRRGSATYSSSSLSLGAHSITVLYGGDGSDAPGESAPLTQIVARASTQVTLTSSAEPAVFGSGATVKAAVRAVAPGHGTPTGSVTFSEGASTLATVALNSSANATYRLSELSVGQHTITATYSGSEDFSGAEPQSLIQTIVRAESKITLSRSANPAKSGSAAFVKAVVKAVAPGNGTPTGAVTFSEDASILAVVTLEEGIAKLPVGGLPVGEHTITASYEGDQDFTAAEPVSILQTIKP